MMRVHRLLLCLAVVVGVAALAAQVGAEKAPETSVMLEILGIHSAQWKGMTRAQRYAYLKSLPTETRQELRSALAARRGVTPREQRRQGTPAQVATSARKPKAVGLIRYDTGNPGGYFATGQIKGNRFDTALTPGIAVCPGGPGSCPPVLDPGTITKLSAFLLPAPPSGAPGSTVVTYNTFRVFGPQSGSVVPLIFNYTVWGAPPSATITLTPSPPISYAGPSFQVGLHDLPGWTTSWVTTSPTTTTVKYYYSRLVPAWDSGTTGQQGFHAISLSGSTTAVITPIGGRNMMVRATGTILVPVELMSFSIE